MDYSEFTGSVYRPAPLTAGRSEKTEKVVETTVENLDTDKKQTVTGSGQQPVPLWVRYQLDADNLDLYSQKVRSWISRTILKRLVKEADSVNSYFAAQSRPDLLIGDASFASLQHVLSARGSDQLPTLHRVLPYLELSSNQQYLLKRIRDLARDGCLYEFRWDAGGTDPAAGDNPFLIRFAFLPC